MDPELQEQEYLYSDESIQNDNVFYQSININGCFKAAEIYLA